MRRTRPERRIVNPDVRYQNVVISSFINRIMRRGKKSTATTLVYGALEIMGERTGKNPVDVFEQALKNVGPVMEVRPRRVGGATYQVPMEVPASRRMTLAMRWVIEAARARTEKSMAFRIAHELMDAAENRGGAVRKREDTHRMAEANKAFAHYRW